MSPNDPTNPRRGRPPRSHQQADDTRQRVIAAARALFVQDGYDGVSMRKIAQLAGCSPAALYTLFPGKRQLLLHLWEEIFRQLLARLEACYQDTPAPGRLAALCLAFIDFWLSRPDDYRAIFLIEDRPDSNDEVYFVDSAGVLDRLDILRRAIVEAQAGAVLGPGDPDEILSLLLCGMQGVLLNLITIPEYPWGGQERVKQGMVRLLMADLR